MEKEIEINGVIYVQKAAMSSKVIDENDLKAVLIRTYSAGIHYGYLREYTDTPAGRVVKLLNTRRIWSWKGAATLSQMALEGVKYPNECKFSVVLPENEIIDVIEIIPLSNDALISLNSVPAWKI